MAALAALDVLDTPNDPDLDRLAQIAARVCGTPISLISLIDRDRLWFKANVGLVGVSETWRDHSFCDHAIHDDTVFEITDAAADPRFADSPHVTGAPHIRFYAGAPLILSSGHRVGVLCVIAPRAMALDKDQRATLEDLAALATWMMEARRASRQALAELTDATERAESSELAKADFLAHMSHELRTPLNAVIGFAGMLQHEIYGPLPHAYHDAAATIAESGTHLLSMINDLLDLGMLEEGALRLHVETVDLHDLITDAMRMLGTLAHTRGIRFEVAFLERPASTLDRRTIRQALINVIGHALKHGSDNGVVGLTVAQKPDGSGEITVRDDGAGMTEEQIARAFDPYQRRSLGRSLESRIARSDRGLGLGVARRFVELNGGQLSLAPAPR
ncbi:MAG: GAF domain-containing sensor histidine kinase [Alphaproteobacteria bacterium]|nr:GAF domain-containing sensor histidine kinase [Alphaproteobacteria bacterium]